MIRHLPTAAKTAAAAIFIASLVACSASAEEVGSTEAAVSAPAAAFHGSCTLIDATGKSVKLGTFTLDHAAALASECPHQWMPISEDVMANAPKGLGVYVEHQNANAGFYLISDEKQLDYASVDVLVSGVPLVLRSSVNGSTVRCKGVLH